MTQVEDAITRLFQGTAGAVGTDYFAALTRSIVETFGMRHGIVARFRRELGVVEVISWCEAGDPRAPIQYRTEGTPCDHVLKPASLFYEEGVQEAFPEDRFLVDEGIVAYLGIPMLDRHGESQGHLIAMHDSPVCGLSRVHRALTLFADRAAAELGRLDAESVLVRRERRLAGILEAMSDGVWEIDAEGRTTYVNGRLEAMLGYAPGTMLGRPLYEFMSTEAQDEAKRNVERRQRGIAERHSFPLLRTDGSTLWTRMASTPQMDDDGRYVGALAVVTDMTLEHAVERRLVDAQKLEGLELLAAGVAHDYNNVLGAILAHAQLASRRPELDPIVKRSLVHIEGAVRGAVGLTQQLRAYAGAPSLGKSPLDLGNVARDIAAVVAPTITAKARLTVDVVDASGGLETHGERGGIEQAILNLLINAREVVPEGGHVHLRVALHSYSAEDLDRSRVRHNLVAGRHVVLEVTDDGAGIDDETAARVFDPFFSTKGDGRGLGLAIVRGVCKSHGAALELETAPGKGTTFRLVFERFTGSSLEGEGCEHDVPDPAGPLSVLLVDDDEGLRDSLETYLREEGHVVVTARSGRGAEQAVREGDVAFDVVFMDIMMPAGDGVAALRAIREMDPSLPVVLMTGAAGAEAIDVAEADPSTVLLLKPFAPQRLVQEARRLAFERHG